MGSRYREDNYSSSRGGGERWDRDRLDSYDRQRPPRPPHPPSGPERDPYDDREYYQRTERRDPSPRRERERVIYAERDRYEIPSRPRYRYDDEADRSAGAMVPRPREEEREIDIEIRRREYNRSPPSPLPAPPREFERPRFVRRQSSLDTYDRKPMPKYGDVARVREETVMIPASRHRSPPRYRSPPRFDEYEEIGIDERDREFAGYREREISRVRTRKEGPDYEIEEREEIIEETRNLPKRGKTKMPIRLVNTEVLIKLDYPFEQQGETIIILKALHKDHIDEIIRLSRELNVSVQETKTRYTVDDPHHNSGSHVAGAGIDETLITKRTTLIKEVTPGAQPSPTVPRSVRDWDVLSQTITNNSRSLTPSPPRSPSPARPLRTLASLKPTHTHTHSHSHSRARARSTSATIRREIIISTDREESAPIRSGVGALIVPAREGRELRKTRDIQAEIRALEAEKRALKAERKSGLAGQGEMVVVTQKDDEVVEVRRDRRGKMMLVR